MWSWSHVSTPHEPWGWGHIVNTACRKVRFESCSNFITTEMWYLTVYIMYSIPIATCDQRLEIGVLPSPNEMYSRAIQSAASSPPETQDWCHTAPITMRVVRLTPCITISPHETWDWKHTVCPPTHKMWGWIHKVFTWPHRMWNLRPIWFPSAECRTLARFRVVCC